MRPNDLSSELQTTLNLRIYQEALHELRKTFGQPLTCSAAKKKEDLCQREGTPAVKRITSWQVDEAGQNSVQVGPWNLPTGSTQIINYLPTVLSSATTKWNWSWCWRWKLDSYATSMKTTVIYRYFFLSVKSYIAINTLVYIYSHQLHCREHRLKMTQSISNCSYFKRFNQNCKAQAPYRTSK